VGALGRALECFGRAWAYIGVLWARLGVHWSALGALGRLLKCTFYIYPLQERDQNGCRVIMIKAKQLDTKKFLLLDMLRLTNLIEFTLAEEHETQIAGFMYAIDNKGIKMDYFALCSGLEVFQFIKNIDDVMPFRQKKALWLNLPGFAVTAVDLIKTGVSKKMKERFFVSKDISILKNHVDVKILPKEYGGQVPAREMIESFRKVIEDRKERLRQMDENFIDMDYMKKNGYEDANDAQSFRKLDID